MNCLDATPTVQTVVQGEDLSLNVKLILADNGDPFDITNATEIIAIFPSTNQVGFIEKKLSLGGVVIASGPGGRMVLNAAPADTMLFTVGPAISFEVRVTIAGKITTVQFMSALNVVASLFPTA